VQQHNCELGSTSLELDGCKNSGLPWSVVAHLAAVLVRHSIRYTPLKNNWWCTKLHMGESTGAQVPKALFIKNSHYTVSTSLINLNLDLALLAPSEVMESKQTVHMNQGQGETSYALNSSYQVSSAALIHSPIWFLRLLF
jgi:hypothetical protein